MSPDKKFPWEKREPTPAVEPEKVEEKRVEPVAQEVKEEVKPQPESPKPMVVMSQLDSYLTEIMKEQPETLETISSTRVSAVETPGLHRMSLSEYFEARSYDCTRGDSCNVHQKDRKGKVLNKGKFILRWVLKDKRAIDYARNVAEWVIVNRRYFPDAPRTEFSANGGVERGDAILALMPAEKALSIRESPGKRSTELLRSRMSPSRQKAGRVLMSGNPEDERFYEPDMGAEESEKEGVLPPGTIQVE